MPDRSDEYRRSASECLYLARMSSDERARASLVTMAQKWLALANEPPDRGAIDVAVRGSLKEGQVSETPAMQQQQQIQPKEDNEG